MMNNNEHLVDRSKAPVSNQDPQAVYLSHASAETVAQGKLSTDLLPKQLFRAFRILLAKNTLARKRLPIKLDLEQYRNPSYQYDTTSTLAVAERLKSVPLTKEGMKWIHHYDGELCIQFYGEKFIDIDFDELISRVDIARVGDCFKDVLGINTVVLQQDEKGRPTLQIERIAALAQPNYSAFLGKDELDVYKLEYQEYTPDEVRNWMRTVCSPNASTVADDSYMAFKRMPGGKGTKIEFVALQQFPLPRIMVLLQLSRWPWLRRFLTRAAYRGFWGDTVNNIVSRYYGNDFAIGKNSKSIDKLGATNYGGERP